MTVRRILQLMNEDIEAWMKRHGFSSVNDFKGRLAQEKSEEGYKWERTQFLKTIG